MPKNYVSIPDAAKLANCSPKTIRRRISDGTIPAYRMGPRMLRVDQADIERAMRPIPTAGRGAV